MGNFGGEELKMEFFLSLLIVCLLQSSTLSLNFVSIQRNTRHLPNTGISKHLDSSSKNYVNTFRRTVNNDEIFDGNSYLAKLSQTKLQISQFGATLDRGQSYNPTSGIYYQDRMEAAKNKIKELISLSKTLPTSLSDFNGEWELIFTSVPHGIFRSSPFFLAIQNAYANVGEIDKANLFFKLHELQTCSWGASKIGRVAQRVDAEKGLLTSEFDTALFTLTSIPVLGWFKLLPTFGGCVITVSKASLSTEITGRLDLEVDYTTAKQVEGLKGLGNFAWDTKVPVGAIWRLLPWNNGRSATCSLQIRYCDGDFRVMEDIDGEYFVYARPLCPRD